MFDMEFENETYRLALLFPNYSACLPKNCESIVQTVWKSLLQLYQIKWMPDLDFR